jgi:Helix-turn-helix domain
VRASRGCFPEDRVALATQGVAGPFQMDRELYSIEQARALLDGIARNTLHDLLRSGALASVPIGRRRFISARAIAAFIAESTTTDGPDGAMAAAARDVRVRLVRPPNPADRPAAPPTRWVCMDE